MAKQYGITKEMTPEIKVKVISCAGKIRTKSIALILGLTYCQVYQTLLQEGFIESSSKRYRKDRNRNKRK